METNKMRSKLFAIAFLVTTLIGLPQALASMRWLNESGVALGNLSAAKCATGLTCSVDAGKLRVATGIESRVTATATTITASQCGSTFVNSGAVAINLPEASGVIGCRLTFLTAISANFDVNPDDNDQILILTNAAGDSIRNAVIGSSVVLEAASTSAWAPVGKEQGTWSDIN
jgi:hypothetical protein